MYLKNLMDNKENQISFHMPGHKENYTFFEKDILNYDLTEYADFDNLASPKSVISNSLDRIEKIFGSEKSFILVNGSTVGILASLFYVNSLGGEILAYRPSHKSFFNGVSLTGQIVTYYSPIIDYNGINFNLDYSKIEISLKENRKIKSLYITSPTYEGVCFDIKRLSEICKKYEVLLIVDEAHGAHFPLHSNFPTSSIKYADIVINSLHKTLPALTQTALLHTKNIHKQGLAQYINMLQTSSPSYLFMYSIDKLMEDIENNELDFNKYISNIETLRNKIKTLKNIKILDYDNIDNTRITIYSDKVLGEYINNFLINNNIYCEMYINNYVVLITSICDNVQIYNYLFDVLNKLDIEINNFNNVIDKKSVKVYNYTKTINNKSIFTLKECLAFNSKSINFSLAENKISKDFIIPYPPGVPILLPGEVITKDIINSLKELLNQNIEVLGIVDNNMRVIEGDDFYSEQN